MNPIETRYKGYRFRSRLEARWAVFMDTIGVPWEYEREGFDLGEAGWYLPDFWLPTLGKWLEVKPNEPNAEELAKAKALCQYLKQHVHFLVGVPQMHEFPVSGPCGPEVIRPIRGYRWLNIEFFRHPKAILQNCLPEDLTGEPDEEGTQVKADSMERILRDQGSVSATRWLSFYGIFDQTLGFPEAVEAARSARFEHGESPLVHSV